MDTPGSDNATESSNTSTPDTSSSESPSAQIMTGLEDTVSSKVDDGPVASDDDDSVSDVSMAAETEDEDDDGPSISTIQINPGMHVPQVLAAEEPPTSTTNKRKYSASTEDTPEDDFRKGPPSTPSPLEYRKRLKPDVINMKYRTPEGHLHQDKSLLPAEIWHYIFTFIPPRELGLLLRVNKSFNASLDPSSLGNSVTPLSKSALQLLNPDSIWQASRRRHYWSLMPSPLQGKSELDMWKLACSFSCQYCGKKRPESSVPSDSWHPGPGENGVVPIWSFGVRACGPCLQERTSKVAQDIVCISSICSILITARKSSCSYRHLCLRSS
jgi:hypothetical protein